MQTINKIRAALDFSWNEASLALADETNQVLASETFLLSGHDASTLPDRLGKAVRSLNRDLSSVAEWTVGTGPGGFTGLRVASALVIGLAYGAPETRVRGMSSAVGLAVNTVMKHISALADKQLITVKRTSYIDNKGTLIPPDANCVAHLAIATGKIEKSFAMRDLYKFAVFLQQNSFWRAQVEQIHVLPDSTLEIVPRVGDHTIYLGRARDFDRKLARVKELYRKGLNRVGWNKYERINVEFDNQIICTKR